MVPHRFLQDLQKQKSSDSKFFFLILIFLEKKNPLQFNKLKTQEYADVLAEKEVSMFFNTRYQQFKKNYEHKNLFRIVLVS